MNRDIRTNTHHILTERVAWEANKDNRALRRSLGMMARLTVVGHQELHANCPAVPAFNSYMARAVRNNYIPNTNPFRGIDNLLFAIEQSKKNPKTHQIERELAELTAKAVWLQIPYLKEGIVTDD